MKYTTRWQYFIAAAANGFFLGVLFVWTYFRDELAKIFPTWRASDLSLIFSVHNVVICLSLLGAGFLLKKLSNRVIVAIGAVGLLVGFGMFPFLPLDKPDTALLMATILFGVISAASVGISSTSGYSLYIQWAPDHPGKMVGTIMLALSVAPILMGALCSVLVPAVGVLQTIRWVGVIASVLLMATIPFARPPGASDNLPPAPVRAENIEQREFRPTEMFCMPSFWILFVFNTVIRASGLMIIDFGGSIAIHLGLTAILGMLYSPANGTANIVGGVLVDKLSTARVIMLCGGTLLLASILLFAGNAADSGFLVMAGLLIGGLSYGCGTVHSTASMRILFGQKHYALNWSYIQLSILIAATCGYLAGVLLDRQSGDYMGVYIMILCCALLTIACGIAMGIYMKRQASAKSGAAVPQD